MDPMQAGIAVGSLLVGAIGSRFAFKNDLRADKKAQDERDAAIVSQIKLHLEQELRIISAENNGMRLAMELTSESVKSMSNTIENKLATKQELAMLTMRLDAHDAKVVVMERELRDTQLRCARYHNGTGTAAIPRG